METNAEKFRRIHHEQLTAGDLAKFRQIGFAGAGVSLGVVLVVAQIAGTGLQALPSKLEWAICLSAAALPMWFFGALVYDVWHTRKLSAVQLNAVKWQSLTLAVGGFILPFILNAGSVFSLLKHFSCLGAGLFAIGALLGVVLLMAFIRRAA